MTRDADLLTLTPAHAAAAAEIHRACFPQAPWSEDAIATLLDNPHVFGLISPAGGFILCQAIAPEAEILTLGVIPPSRRAGLGRDLLAAAFQEMRRRGADHVFLEVADDNKAAQALYREAGFLINGRRHQYYESGRDALMFTKNLSE